MKSVHLRIVASIAAIGFVVACGDPVTTPDTSPLAGLNRSMTYDTSNAVHNPTGTGPGYFRGTVLGQAPPGAGNDSLNTAPRISGVVVTIYSRKPGTGDVVEAGEVQGTVTTGTDGLFTLPTLPAGDYVVTFVPPAAAGYHGVYVHGPLRANSNEYPWWIVLHKK